MNREIKIRIPVFYEGKFIRFDIAEIKITKGANSYAFGNCTYVGDYTLGEPQLFTGLKDKHGKECFEGDIIKIGVVNGYGNFPYDGVKKERIVSVFWSDFRSSWAVKFNDFANNDLFTYSRNGNEFEIIGNIHSNPDLLK